MKWFFQWLVNFFRSDRAQQVFKLVQDLMLVALPIVKQIAAMTPTRSDDEIVQVIERYGLKITEWSGFLNIPMEDRGVVLRDIAVEVLRRTIVNSLKPEWQDVPQNVVDSSVQLAVTVMKAEAV